MIVVARGIPQHVPAPLFEAIEDHGIGIGGKLRRRDEVLIVTSDLRDPQRFDPAGEISADLQRVLFRIGIDRARIVAGSNGRVRPGTTAAAAPLLTPAK